MWSTEETGGEEGVRLRIGAAIERKRTAKYALNTSIGAAVGWTVCLEEHDFMQGAGSHESWSLDYVYASSLVALMPLLTLKALRPRTRSSGPWETLQLTRTRFNDTIHLVVHHSKRRARQYDLVRAGESEVIPVGSKSLGDVTERIDDASQHRILKRYHTKRGGGGVAS